MASEKTSGRRGLYWLLVIVFAAGTFAALAMALSIAKRKVEAREVVLRIVDIKETTVDPAEWGKNFPRQYDSYIRTVDNERTRYGGSDAAPAPGGGTHADSKLESDPRLKTIFNGYAFAIDYRERRGHAFMLDDQRDTERVKQRPQPGACLMCHASNLPAMRKVGVEKGAPGTVEAPLLSSEGQAQLLKGFEAVCAMKYSDATALVNHPVTCLDCHDPDSMALRVTRPAFTAGIRALAESTAPTPHLPSIEQWRKGDRKRAYDPNVDASRQEMRSMACGQCHVEYYFKGEGKVLTFPWHNGLQVEQIEKYYNDVKWNDYTHADSGAPILKAQHPEFETWGQGIHARSGVACADCHMPYKREGAIKISDHQVRSPMLNVARACQTCHNYTESEIKSRVDVIQDRHKQLMDRAEIAVVDLINAIKAAKEAGATDEQLKPARELQRAAQWRTDFCNAENSMGFHAPQESARILGEAIDFARQGQVAVAKLKPPSAAASRP